MLNCLPVNAAKSPQTWIEILLLLARSDIPASGEKTLQVCNLSDLVAEEVLVFEHVFFQNRKSVTAQIAEAIQIRGNCRELKILRKNKKGVDICRSVW